jgi:uncharacterized repeat protein (TIGR03803 family)
MNRIASFCIQSAFLATVALACAFPTRAAGGLTVLHAFDKTDGAFPQARLVQGPDGGFYGTTTYGGQNGDGVVFRVDASGGFSTLYSFPKSGAVSPLSGLVLMDDGFFYGSTPRLQVCGDTPPRNPRCKIFGGGSVFRIAADGTFATLHVFKNFLHPRVNGPLTDGGDNLLYGVGTTGGADDIGIAYAISTDGIYVPLADFHEATTGGPSFGGLTRAADGNLYGTTNHGGAHLDGTVFRMTPDGTMTTLYDFTNGADGGHPSGNLLQGSDGRLYGGAGTTLFAITTGGALTVLHTFDGTDGTGVQDRLAEGDDGWLYGTSLGGGSNNGGTLYRLSKDGQQFEVLHMFTPQEGTSPRSGPIFGSDGRLYGTLSGNGGPRVSGSIYAFDLTAARAAKPSRPDDQRAR